MTDKQITDCIAMLESVCTGDLAIVDHDDPNEIVLGTVDYHLTNGWTIQVCVDNHRWDGVQGFVTEHGESLRPWNDKRPAIEQDSAVLWELLTWKPHRGEMAIWGWPA